MKKNVASQYAPSMTVVNVADGSGITTGVTVYVTVDNGTQTAGGGTVTHKGNGEWSYAPTQAETNGDKVAFKYQHASAVGGGPSATVYPTFPQTGDSFARLGENGAGLTALGDTRLANLDAAISTRSTFAGGAVASVTGNVGGNVVGSVGSVVAAVTVGTNNDKTGYALTQTFPTNFALLAIDGGGAVTDADSGGGSSLTAQDVRDEVDAALVAYDAVVAADLPTNFGSLGINVSGHISRVTLVDTTTTNTDMRGTDSAYTGTPPTAAENATAVRSEITTELGRIDVAVSEAATPAEVTSALTTYDPPTRTEATSDKAEILAAVGTVDDFVDTEIVTMKNLLEADQYVDTSTTPWSVVYMLKGTGGIGVGTELLRKAVYDKDGGNVTSTTTVIGRQVDA